MKVKVTVTGTLDLCKVDVKALRKVSAGHVLDTMRYGAKDLSVEFEGPEERTKAKAAAKAEAEAKAKAAAKAEAEAKAEHETG